MQQMHPCRGEKKRLIFQLYGLMKQALRHAVLQLRMTSPSTLHMANAFPRINFTSLNSTANANDTSQNLTLYFMANDADGDIINNITNWYVNGKSITLVNYPFESVNNSAVNNTRDYSGYVHNSTQIGAVWNVSGGYNNKSAYDFERGRITFNGSSLVNLGSFSISAWVKPRSF